MKTLYVTDLDGTLLNSNTQVSEYSINTINRLVEQGMLFTYATARSLVSASVVTKGLSAQIPVIVYNGARVVRPEDGEILCSVNFTKDQIEKVVCCLRGQKVFPLVYSDIDGCEKVSWAVNHENTGIQNYLNHRKKDKRLRPLSKEKDLYNGDIFYFTCIGTKEEMQPIYDCFKTDNNYTCTLQQELYRDEYWCEIMPRRATKAMAVTELKKLWKCDYIVSFGDAINDIPMFQVSDESYAVANAVEELKAIATGVIESNNKDGVARWLKQYAASTSKGIVSL